MRRYISILSGLAIVVLVGAIGGCAQSPIGVFESIELEREIIDDRALDNDLVVGAIAKSGGNYFIAAATLWHRAVVDVDYPTDVAQWGTTASPGSSNFTTSSLTVFAGSGTELIYATYSSQNGTEGGIYTVDPAGDLGSVAAVPVFGTDLTDVAGVGEVFVADDGIASYLLVGVRGVDLAAFPYALYASPTGLADSFDEVVGTAGNLPVIDVAESASGAVAFLTEKAVLVDSDGLNAGLGPTDVTGNMAIVASQPEFGGIYFHPASDTLWVTDNEGYLYHSPDFGATWSANAAPHPVSTSDEDPLQFTDMTAVDNRGTELLIVGTEGHGYRELDVNFVPTTPAAEVSNYQASELTQGSILTFYVDPASTVSVPAQSGEDYELSTGDLLFAGTSNLGLWKVLFDGNPPQWVRE